MNSLHVLATMFVAWGVAVSSADAASPSQCSPDNPSFCLNGVSGTVTSLDALRVRIGQPESRDNESDKRGRQASLRPIRVAADGTVSSLGLQASGWGVWAAVSRARFEGTVPVVPYDADLDTLTLGVDRLLAGRFLLGGALIHERVDTRTRYNFGGQDGTGNTVTLYGSYLVSDAISIDLTVGKGRIDTDQTRLDPASAVGVPLFLRSNYDSDRSLWSLTFNASRQFSALGVGARVGYLNARERQEGYSEVGGPSARVVTNRTVSLGQLFGGVDASYGLSRSFQMHGAMLYRRDTSRNDGRNGGGLPNAVGSVQPTDRDELEWVVGLRFYGGRGRRLNLEYLNTSGRDQFKNESLTITGRFDF